MSNRPKAVISAGNGDRSHNIDRFLSINERPVDDISLEFFYKPHTLTLLASSILAVLYIVYTRDDENTDQNIWCGIKAMTFFFLVISVLTFPNGPFTRPHPAVWRMVFGLSVFYLIFLQFALFQNFKDLKSILRWVDPVRLNKTHLDEKEYAINCSQITPQRVWSHVDIFAAAHFIGWAFKAVLIRHYVICWYLSIMWEVTEMFFSHLLPNFAECWWDILFLDIFLCNGLGIWFGMLICRKLEMRTYHWESIKNISSTRGKLKRAVLQFTPVDWIRVRWLDPQSTLMRYVAVWILVVTWQFTELNTFFLKHIFAVDTDHPLNTFRLFLIGAIGAPAMRQFYSYVTDPCCKRLGTQCWVYCAICLTELLICIRFGLPLFAQTHPSYIVIWICLMFVGSVICVYLCMFIAKWSNVTEKVEVNGEIIHKFIDSSTENLSELPDDIVPLRHRRRTAKASASSLD